MNRDAAATATRADRVVAWTRPAVRALKPYYKAPIDGDPLRLDQNTNLWGRNPVLDEVPVPDMDQYPSRDGDDLLAALADWHGLSSEHFVVGNGSDELLDLVTKAFAAPQQTMALPAPSYSLYPFYAALQDLRLQRVPMRWAFRVDVDGILAAKPQLVVVASPNNPTGNRVPAADLERLLAGTDGVVVVDEAYIEYAGLRHSMLGRVEEFDNLVVMRTFSKAYGLAGLRIGYVAANTLLAARLRLVKPPFNLNTYSERVAVAAVAGQAFVDGVVAGTVAERERLGNALTALGFRVHPSQANFLLTEHNTDPGIIADGLRRRGILVRTFAHVDGLEHAVRFGVGRPEHSDRLLTALAEVLA